jgi:Tol biopolymer transport system component
MKDTDVLGISPSGEVAVLQNQHRIIGWCFVGTLAMTSVNGGAPRPIMENASAMAWTPDGSGFAVVRYVDKRYRLEYPAGKTLFTTNGWISSPRFSPKGDLIAFIHHPIFGDDRGEIAVVDREGHARVLAANFASAQGLAWMPSTNEIWFTASDTGTLTALRAVTRDGKTRVVTRSPGRLLLADIAQDGRVLLTEENARRVIMVSVPEHKAERDVALLDWSLLRDISTDGKHVLLVEEGEGGGPNYSVYLRNLDDGSAIRLGDGEGWALSPDGKWVLSDTLTLPRKISLLPTGAGERKLLDLGGIDFDFGTFTPDGNSIVFSGSLASTGRRIYVLDIKGGPPRPVTPAGVAGQRIRLVSPDSKSVLVNDEGKWWIYSLTGGEPIIANPEKNIYAYGFSRRTSNLYLMDAPK